MFAGLKFTALGEAKSPSVRNAIEEHGGKFFLEMEDTEVDYIIVRLVRYVAFKAFLLLPYLIYEFIAGAKFTAKN